VLPPGGMGSELRRSDMPCEGQSEVPKRNDYDPVWIDSGIFPLLGKDGLKLEIDDRGRDLGAHAIVADGPFAFLRFTPYNGVEKFCDDKRWNFVIFGYDWRRPLREAADNLRSFLRTSRMPFRKGMARTRCRKPIYMPIARAGWSSNSS
jgi:hypothetical protein